jgi:ribosomal-protein-alanine N-acetyltransferase
MVKVMIESKRLFIRPYSLDDAEEAFSWFSDPGIMEFMPNGPDADIVQTEKRIKHYIQHFKTFGYSKYIIIEKETKKLIGDCGILKLENTGLNELGFRISKPYQEKGYATEAALAVLDFWFNELNSDIIHAVVEPDNIRSIHVTENKLGFNYTSQIECFGQELRLYFLTKEIFFKMTHEL